MLQTDRPVDRPYLGMALGLLQVFPAVLPHDLFLVNETLDASLTPRLFAIGRCGRPLRQPLVDGSLLKGKLHDALVAEPSVHPGTPDAGPGAGEPASDLPVDSHIIADADVRVQPHTSSRVARERIIGVDEAALAALQVEVRQAVVDTTEL